MAALGLGVALAAGQLFGLTPRAFDAGAYFRAEPGSMYPASWLAAAAPYVYPPPLAQALELVGWLPEPVFLAAWTMLLVAVLVAVTREWSIVLLLAAVPYLAFGVFYPGSLVLSDIAHGNIHVLLGAAAVAGFRWPAAWAFILLTKMTPGIGLLWFAVRREWRPLGIALAATAAVALVSFALGPGDWSAWLGFTLANADATPTSLAIPIPLWARLVASAALVTWGARTDRQWTVPVAVGFAIPIGYPTMVAAMVAGIGLARTRP